MGAQIVQVLVGEFSGITVDEVELVGDVACGGRDAGLGGADVGSKRHAILEGNDITARDSVFSLRNSERGSHLEKIP